MKKKAVFVGICTLLLAMVLCGCGGQQINDTPTNLVKTNSLELKTPKHMIHSKVKALAEKFKKASFNELSGTIRIEKIQAIKDKFNDYDKADTSEVEGSKKVINRIPKIKY